MSRAAVPEQRENGEQLPASVVVAQLRSKVEWLEAALLREQGMTRQLLLVIRLGRYSNRFRAPVARQGDLPHRRWRTT